MICVGLNYADHAREGGKAIPTEPVIFAKYRNTLIGPGDPIKLPKAAQNEFVLGYLVAPNGMVMSSKANLAPTASGDFTYEGAIDNFVRNPIPGRWRYIVMLNDPQSGLVVSQPFTARVGFAAATITPVRGLPRGGTLARGKTTTFTYLVKNSSPETLAYAVDPRLTRRVNYQLASQTANEDQQHLALPNPATNPSWIVPTGTSQLSFYANATVPVGLDVSYVSGDPEVYGPAQGNSASVSLAAPELPNGPWNGDLGEPGPFTGPAPTGTASANAVARTYAFDLSASSDLGDLQLAALIPATSSGENSGATGVPLLNSHRSKVLRALAYQRAHSAVKSATAPAPSCASLGGILAPGASCTVTVAVTPTAAKGSTVSGTLHFQDADIWNGTADDLTAFRYRYTVK